MSPQVEVIEDPASGARAEILVSLGFNLFRWSVQDQLGPWDILWAEEGFGAGTKRPSSSGIPLLFPFPGRVGQAKFEFGGKTYQLDESDGRGNALHGFVLNRPWRVFDQTPSSVTGEFHASVDAPDVLEHWPSDFRIRVRYEVTGGELRSTVTYDNPGNSVLPCGFGTHAYFRIPLTPGSEAKDMVITAPVDHEWPMDNMVPTGKRRSLDWMTPFVSGLTLGDRKFDTVYGVIPSSSVQTLETVVDDPASGRRLVQSFGSDFRSVVIYTPGHGEAVCLEPYTNIPDPFRLTQEVGDIGWQELQPGESRTYQLDLEAQFVKR